MDLLVRCHDINCVTQVYESGYFPLQPHNLILILWKFCEAHTTELTVCSDYRIHTTRVSELAATFTY